MYRTLLAAKAVPWALGATLLFAAATAHAQEGARALVDRGVEAYEEGRFAEAAALFDRASDAEGLTREDVVRVLSTRVLVAQGMGDDGAVEAAILQLVTLEPDGLGTAASPQLQRMTAQALEQTGGATVAIDIEHRVDGERLLVRTRVRGDVGGLVRRVQLMAREGGGAWVPGEGGEVRLANAAAADVEVVAVAVGPGGAPLARVGTQEAPHRLVRPVPAAALHTDEEEGSDDGVLIGVLVGVAVVAVAAGVILGVVFGTQGSQDTTLMPPVVEW
ncbi:MAG: hypothetical protein H6719_33105 [Sandaracinaceae bacterium]|nr:hypothetical protein [Sandaracinaceae bacterium]